MGADTDKARKELQKKRAALSQVEQEMEVKDLRHAGSREIMEYCVAELSSGTTWTELRHKLGLGPAHVDQRWRKIRTMLTAVVLPSSEEEALQAQINSTEMILAKTEELIEYVEKRSRAAFGSKAEDKLLKVQLDALKLYAEQNQTKFQHFMDMKKLQVDDRKNQGPSIIYQNNFYIPRPGDPEERIVIPHKDDGGKMLTKVAKVAADADDSGE